MSEVIENFVDELYEAAGMPMYLPEVSDRQIARELAEHGLATTRQLNEALSPPLLRFFARLEWALTTDDGFAGNVSELMQYHPSYVAPYSALPFDIPTTTVVNDLGEYRVAQAYTEKVIEHDEGYFDEHPVPGDYFSGITLSADGLKEGLTAKLRLAGMVERELSSRDSDLPYDLRTLLDEAHESQHRDGYCTTGKWAFSMLRDKMSKTDPISTVAEPIVGTWLPYRYSTYRMIRTNASFGLAAEVRIPVIDATDVDELASSAATVRSVGALTTLMSQDKLLLDDFRAVLRHDKYRTAIVKHTARAGDGHLEERDLQKVMLHIVEEGIGAAIPPVLGELRRPTPEGLRMSLAEIVMQRMVERWTKLSPIAYAGKINLRGVGLKSVVTKDELNDVWRPTREALNHQRGVRRYMAREYHYRMLGSREDGPVQLGVGCPVTRPVPGLGSDVISGATDVIYLMTHLAKTNYGITNDSYQMRYALRQQPPSRGYAPNGAPVLTDQLEQLSYNYPDGRRYHALGRALAKKELALVANM